jgi:hypothetical protein
MELIQQLREELFARCEENLALRKRIAELEQANIDVQCKALSFAGKRRREDQQQ